MIIIRDYPHDWNWRALLGDLSFGRYGWRWSRGWKNLCWALKLEATDTWARMACAQRGAHETSARPQS